MFSKEKTVGSSVDDYNIWTKIKASFLEHHEEVPGIMTSVSVEVSEGRVLLTGSVKSTKDRLTVLRLVWQQHGVREVINEIKLSDELQKQGIKQYTADTWITTQVKSKMLLNKEVRSINFNIETIDSVVYILGIARSEDELIQIRNIVTKVKNVKKFVSYIRVVGERDIKEKGNVQVAESKEKAKVLSEGTKVDESVKSTSTAASTAKAKEVPDDDIDIEYIDSDDD